MIENLLIFLFYAFLLFAFLFLCYILEYATNKSKTLQKLFDKLLKAMLKQ